MVIGAAGKPAVIQHKALHAQCRSTLGQGTQGGVVVVEVDRLPGVQVHGARAHAAAVPLQHLLARKAVKVLRHAVEAVLRPTGMQHGRAVTCPGRQPQLARRQPDAGLQQGGAIVATVNGKLVVATPGQLRSDHLTLVVGAVRRQRKAGRWRFVRAAAMAVLQLPTAGCQRHAPPLKLMAPLAGKMRHVGQIGGNWQAAAGLPVQLHGVRAVVVQGGVQAQHIAVLPQRQVQLQRQATGLLQMQHQGLGRSSGTLHKGDGHPFLHCARAIGMGAQCRVQAQAVAKAGKHRVAVEPVHAGIGLAPQCGCGPMGGEWGLRKQFAKVPPNRYAAYLPLNQSAAAGTLQTQQGLARGDLGSGHL